jgi:hypothetical protein
VALKPLLVLGFCCCLCIAQFCGFFKPRQGFWYVLRDAIALALT